MKDFIIIALLVISSVLWIWAMIEIAKSRFKVHWHTTLWYLIVWFVPIFGAIVFFQMKRHITKEPKKFNPQLNRSW